MDESNGCATVAELLYVRDARTDARDAAARCDTWARRWGRRGSRSLRQAQGRLGARAGGEQLSRSDVVPGRAAQASKVLGRKGCTVHAEINYQVRALAGGQQCVVGIANNLIAEVHQ